MTIARQFSQTSLHMRHAVRGEPQRSHGGVGSSGGGGTERGGSPPVTQTPPIASHQAPITMLPAPASAMAPR